MFLRRFWKQQLYKSLYFIGVFSSIGLFCLGLLCLGIDRSLNGTDAEAQPTENIAKVKTSERRPSPSPLLSNTTLTKPDEATQVKINETYGRLPLGFEKNQGQADNKLKFISRGSGYSLFLTATEAILDLRSGKEQTDKEALHMQLIDSNLAPLVTGLDELPGKSNYFIGTNPQKWQTNISNYGRVKYQDVYPGIDLIYYGKQRQLEYDFVVKPGANPNLTNKTR